jgi:hypothetical protein
MQLNNEINQTWFDDKEDYTFRNYLFYLVWNYEYPNYYNKVDVILMHPKDFDKLRMECRYHYFPDNELKLMNIPVFSVYSHSIKEGEPMLVTNHNKKRK